MIGRRETRKGDRSGPGEFIGDFKGDFKKIEFLEVTAENRRIPHYVSKRIKVRKLANN